MPHRFYLRRIRNVCRIVVMSIWIARVSGRSKFYRQHNAAMAMNAKINAIPYVIDNSYDLFIFIFLFLFVLLFVFLLLLLILLLLCSSYLIGCHIKSSINRSHNLLSGFIGPLNGNHLNHFINYINIRGL